MQEICGTKTSAKRFFPDAYGPEYFRSICRMLTRRRFEDFVWVELHKKEIARKRMSRITNPLADARIDAVIPRWSFISAMFYDHALNTFSVCTANAVHPPCLHIKFHASCPVFISRIIIIFLISNITLTGVLSCQLN